MSKEVTIILCILCSIPVWIFFVICFVLFFSYKEKRQSTEETATDDFDSFENNESFDGVYRESQNPLWFHFLNGIISFGMMSLMSPLFFEGVFDWYFILIIGLVVFLSGFLFSGMKVRVDNENVRVLWGLFRFSCLRLPLDSIRFVEETMFKPMADFGGWGIKKGYNKHFKAVEGYFMSGPKGVLLTAVDSKGKTKKYLIGSYMPKRLALVIRSKINVIESRS